jgi:hypothetical protein
VRVYRVRDDVHVFLICLHHSVTDLSSFVILGAELQALYAGISLAAPAQLTFAEFAAEQQRRAQDGRFAEQLRYWETQLGNDLPP